MSRTGKKVQVIAAVSLALLLHGAAFGEVSIKLSGVPEVLRIPVPHGANSMMTASIAGGEVKSVWVGIDAPTGSSARVPLAKTGEDEYQVNLGDRALLDLLEPQGADGEFRVFAETAKGAIVRSVSVRFSSRVLPKKLDFPWEDARIALYQRSITDLPGLGGVLRIQLGDIAVEQVLVSVFGPNNEVLADLVRLRTGDAMFIALEDARYVLSVDGLYTMGDFRDFGMFTLMPSRTWEKRRIERLCDLIAGTDVIFIRNGSMLSGAMFASLLRSKLVRYGVENPPLGKFIDQAGTRSRTTGELYRLKMPSGSEGELAPWLHSVAEEIPTAKRP
jgi:hypothetical protein